MKHVANNLYRGPRPDSFKTLKDAGIDTVINLQSGAYEALTETTYEHEIATDFGMKEINIECSDFFPPTKQQVVSFLNIVYGNNCNGRNVYVHCLHGKDRTGFMCAAYRMFICRWSFIDVIKEMFSEGFHKVPYIWWVPFLLRYRR